MSVRPRISVIVLSYDRPKNLRSALESICLQKCPSLEVLVIDNLSPASNEIAEVVRSFPDVKFFPQSANYGFARGMNIGMSLATGKYLHLTEDDIALENGFYDIMLQHAELHPQSLLSGVIHDFPSSGQSFRGLTLEIDRRYVQKPMEVSAHLAEPYSVGMLVGAMMFGRREVFELIGSFREEFFVYFEDSEFCWRARRADIELFVVPTASGAHLASSSNSSRPLIEFHKLKNYLATNLLYMAPVPAFLMALKFITYTSVRKSWELRKPSLLLKLWTWSALYSWRYILERRQSGFEARGKGNCSQSRRGNRDSKACG